VSSFVGFDHVLDNVARAWSGADVFSGARASFSKKPRELLTLGFSHLEIQRVKSQHAIFG
jgi:hypothetical protein